MALMEEAQMDTAYGDYANHDLAEYHVAVNGDVKSIDAVWLDEVDEHISPTCGKGIGEIGIVGIAAAVTNAVWHATGQRVRDLPVRLDKVLAAAADTAAAWTEHPIELSPIDAGSTSPRW